jgi:hypothetical protein
LVHGALVFEVVIYGIAILPGLSNFVMGADAVCYVVVGKNSHVLLQKCGG